MSIISRMRKQTCVYWAIASTPDAYGKPVVSPPVELSCRWQDSKELFVAPDGSEQTSNAKVFVGVDTPEGGVLMLGTLSDITDPVNPKENVGAYEIRLFSNIPNLRATEFLKTAML